MSNAKPTPAQAGQLMDFSFLRISTNPFQPRSVRNPQKTVELAISILSNGLLQPPVGRPCGNGVELAFGMGRYFAHSMIGQIQKRLVNEQTPLLGEFGIDEVSDELAEQFQTLVALASAKLEGGGQAIQSMPVYVKEMSDREMFEMAVAENHDRDNLAPMDLAKSMQTYERQFGASAVEIGQLYHLAGPTVRNLIRLLDLPQEIQVRINKGEVSRGQAIKLLALQGLNPALVEKAGKFIQAEQSVQAVDQTIANAISGDKSIVTMWESYRKDTPLGGWGLWVLDEYTPNQIRKDLDAKTLLARHSHLAVAIQASDESRKVRDIFAMMLEWVADALTTECVDLLGTPDVPAAKKLFSELFSNDEDLIEFIFAQVYPPVCSKCPFHRVMNGNHYCANKPCHTWKGERFIEDQVKGIANGLGIAMYQESEGEYILDKPRGWGTRSDGTHGYLENPFDGWFASDPKNPDLRVIAIKGDLPYPHTSNKHCALVAIGESVAAYHQMVADWTSAAALTSGTDSEKISIEVYPHSKNDVPVWVLASRFLWEHTSLFSLHFDSIPDQVTVMLALAGSDEEGIPNITGGYYEVEFEKDEDEIAIYKKILTHRTILDWAGKNEYFASDLEYFAAMLKDELAESLGADLPESWLEMAREYETAANA